MFILLLSEGNISSYSQLCMFHAPTAANNVVLWGRYDAVTEWLVVTFHGIDACHQKGDEGRNKQWREEGKK